MHINVENFSELVEKHSELQIISDITAHHGEESEVSQLCEVIAKLYQKLDALIPPSKATSTRSKE